MFSQALPTLRTSAPDGQNEDMKLKTSQKGAGPGSSPDTKV